MNIRRNIFNILYPDISHSKRGRVVDILLTLLVLVTVLSMFIGTFDSLASVRRGLLILEGFASLVFSVEYVLRLTVADFLYKDRGPIASRVRYIVSAPGIVDLLSILPFWLPMFFPGTLLGLRAFRLVRLMRIFKLQRYFRAMKVLGEVIASKKQELLGSMFFVVIIMLISSLLMYSVEHEAQPEVFRNAFTGLWWAVATLTTVGYGDIYPVTVLGRSLGTFLAFTGIAAVAIPSGIISSGLTARLSHDRDAERDRLLQEQGETLKRIADELAKINQDGLKR